MRINHIDRNTNFEAVNLSHSAKIFKQTALDKKTSKQLDEIIKSQRNNPNDIFVFVTDIWDMNPDFNTAQANSLGAFCGKRNFRLLSFYDEPLYAVKQAVKYADKLNARG